MKLKTFEQAVAIQKEISSFYEHREDLQAEMKNNTLSMRISSIRFKEGFYDEDKYTRDYLDAIDKRIDELKQSFDSLQDEPEEEPASDKPDQQ